tara:strand:- start:9359 stop:10933 length:1575 start_codon:yes stop_codon:yes gene_type:complete
MKRLIILGSAVTLLGSVARPTGANDDLRLIEAVRTDDIAAVTRLLATDIPIDTPQPDGATALHWAVYRNAPVMVEQLITAGADVNAANSQDVLPLTLAILNRSPAMVTALLNAGADPNRGKETPMMTAAHSGHQEIVTLLLAHGGNANASETLRGQTALMWAAAEGHSDVVKLLINAGANVQSRTSDPPPDPNARMRPRRPSKFANPKSSLAANQFTALLFAVRNGNMNSVKYLLQAGADVNTASADGMSPLVLATVRGWPSVAHMLLEHGANPNAASSGYTALHWAAGSWETELTTASITPAGTNEWTRVAGLTDGKLDLVRALLAHGADPNARIQQTPSRVGSSKNPPLAELEGASPFLLAALAGESEVMRLLAEHGADLGLMTTSNGTPLMAAAGLGRVMGEVSVPDSHVLEATKVLVELEALGDVDAVDSLGNTALHYAAYFKRTGIVQLLAEHGANLNLPNKYGETPLWLSEAVIQYAGGGIYAISQTVTGDLLRQLGAHAQHPNYTLRPMFWPDIPHI